MTSKEEDDIENDIEKIFDEIKPKVWDEILNEMSEKYVEPDYDDVDVNRVIDITIDLLRQQIIQKFKQERQRMIGMMVTLLSFSC